MKQIKVRFRRNYAHNIAENRNSRGEDDWRLIHELIGAIVDGKSRQRHRRKQDQRSGIDRGSTWKLERSTTPEANRSQSYNDDWIAHTWRWNISNHVMDATHSPRERSTEDDRQPSIDRFRSYVCTFGEGGYVWGNDDSRIASAYVIPFKRTIDQSFEPKKWTKE